MSLSEVISPFVGRTLLAWFFLSQAFQRIQEWDAMVTLIQMKNLPFAAPLLALAISLMITGGLFLLVGFQTRFSALILAGCTVAWLNYAHDFWNIRNPVVRAEDYETFALGVAVIGGLLVLVGLGAGRFSLDHEGRRSRG